MDRRASLLIVSLWILVILSVFALAIGQRAAVGLKAAYYQKGSLKAYFTAYGRLQEAIVELKRDPLLYDSLNEAWSTAGLDPETKRQNFYITDEERRINLNSADYGLLFVLLKEAGLFNDAEAARLANNICIWRGDAKFLLNADAVSFGKFKKNYFSVMEELLVMLEFFYKDTQVSGYHDRAEEVFSRLKNFCTVYPVGGGSKININTADPAVINILIKASIKKIQDSGVALTTRPEDLLAIILAYRDKAAFTDDELGKALDLEAADKEELMQIVSTLEDYVTVKSDNFRIASTGQAEGSRVERKIECVFNRQKGIFAYWHEN